MPRWRVTFNQAIVRESGEVERPTLEVVADHGYVEADGILTFGNLSSSDTVAIVPWTQVLHVVNLDLQVSSGDGSEPQASALSETAAAPA